MSGPISKAYAERMLSLIMEMMDADKALRAAKKGKVKK